MGWETHSVNEVQLPGVAIKVLESNGVGVGVEGQGTLNRNIHDHETLGAQLVGQNLDGVADEQTRPGEGVEEREDPDEGDHGVVGAGRALLVVQARGEGPEDESAEHAGGGGQEGGAAAEAVDVQGHGNGNDERHAGLAGREAELLGGVGDAGAVVEQAGVVGDDGIARPLREDTEGEQDDEAVAVALGPEEVEVAAGLLVLKLEADRLLDLAELELDGGIVDVAVGVVLGKHVEGLLVPVLGHQVAGGLRDPVDEGQLDDGGKSLEQGRHAPRPVALGVVGAEGNPGDDYTQSLANLCRWEILSMEKPTQGTDVPQAVVDGGETGTVLGMADLGEKHRGRDLSQAVAETKQSTATHEGYTNTISSNPITLERLVSGNTYCRGSGKRPGGRHQRP